MDAAGWLFSDSLCKIITIANQNCGDIIPGSKALGRLESALLTEMGTERFLKSILHPLRERYDYILIDTNRAASPFMVNALTAADSVLIPVKLSIRRFTTAAANHAASSKPACFIRRRRRFAGTGLTE